MRVRPALFQISCYCVVLSLFVLFCYYCVVLLLFVLFCYYLCCSMYCLCVNVLYHCHRVFTQLQLTNISKVIYTKIYIKRLLHVSVTQPSSGSYHSCFDKVIIIKQSIKTCRYEVSSVVWLHIFQSLLVCVCGALCRVRKQIKIIKIR